jgi:transglutaminase-like putative cysteine protease
LRSVAAEAVGHETNPVRKAKAIFDWVAAHLSYSFALEYSTIPNISAYSLERGYGDCGQQTLVFIALCRQQGIPARWQSGWFLFPGAKNIHDWAEIYLQPWGWVPVDVDLGNAVYRYGHSLAESERREARDFYFGGLDQYRMAANSDHNQRLDPAKRWWRSDDVDFQRGELEWEGRNIYFDQLSYELTIE